MNSNFQATVFKRLSRIPKRLQQDRDIFKLLKNWREVLSAKLHGTNITDLYFRNGFALHSPPQVNLAFLFHEVWLDKVYELEGYEINDTDLVVDIGANIGVFAVYAADQARNGKVLAFEPFPANADFLRRNVLESKLSNTVTFQKAVASTNETRQLTVSEEWIKHSLQTEMRGTTKTSVIDIECITLDEVLRGEKACDLLKIDCEGSEYEIFYTSSPETIKKIRRIVGEYHEVDANERNGLSLKIFLEKNYFTVDLFSPFDENCGAFFARQIYS
jgi:FkbM family methyltransferase